MTDTSNTSHEPERKLVQLCMGEHAVLALCSDGSLWNLEVTQKPIPTDDPLVETQVENVFTWRSLPPIPQGSDG